MMYQVVIPAPVYMIPILMMTTKGTQSQGNDGSLHSDVIVTYANHADASHELKQPKVPLINSTTTTAKPELIKLDYVNEMVESLHKGPIKGSIGAEERNYGSLHSDLITSYLNHADVSEGVKVPKTPMTTTAEPPRTRRIPKKASSEAEQTFQSQEDVIFIPNEKKEEKIRNEDYLQNDRASLGDLIGGHRTVEELLAAKNVRLETESPVTDIIFVLGKNNENYKPESEKGRKDHDKKQDDLDEITTRFPRLRCNNLICNNAIKSVCGEKLDDRNQLKYRLFLNECYFRKVNCHFRNPANRYKKVKLDKCKTSGSQSPTPISMHYKQAPKYAIKREQINDTKITHSSRRSMTMNMNGQFCSHPCPASCPEQYEPECAVSSTGRHRVFVNHCALDHNSCSFGIVWHSVPLSQCVGSQKAELRQNAGFIGWMQRVGIVDHRGRLSYDLQE